MREFAQRFGFGGDIRDLGARIFLDPLNIAGPVALKGLSKASMLMGGSEALISLWKPRPYQG